MDEPLDLERVMALVADAMEAVMLGQPEGEAITVLLSKAPSRGELRAARQENHGLHGGGTPDVLRAAGLGPSPAPPEVLQLRRAIDELLSRAEATIPE